MKLQSSNRSCYEKRRIRAAKLTIVLFALMCAALSSWQCIKDSFAPSSVLPTVWTYGQAAQTEDVSSGDAASSSLQSADMATGSSTVIDPLNIAQEGIELREINDNNTIIWYESSWNVQQSQALFERALILQGWQLVSDVAESALTFSYPASGLAGGGTLLASFYDNTTTCSILVELT